MELREIKAFVRAYECGSFTVAAQELCMSRQALSKTVGRLESEIGTLFEREARGLRPTQLGSSVYPHAKRMLDEQASIGREARRCATELVGAITLAAEASAMLTLPVGVLGRYRRARPGIKVASTVLPADAARASFLAGEVNALIASPLRPSDAAEDGFVDGAFCATVRYERVLRGRLSIVYARAGLDLPVCEDAICTDDVRGGKRDDAWDEARMGCERLDGARTSAVPQDCAADPVTLLDGNRVFGVSPQNRVEREIVPYLARRGVSIELAYDCADTALATEAMEAGLGGVIVEATVAHRKFGDATHVVIDLTGDDAPAWEVGVTYQASDASAPVARDLAAFMRAELAQGV